MRRLRKKPYYTSSKSDEDDKYENETPFNWSITEATLHITRNYIMLELYDGLTAPWRECIDI